MTRAGAVSFRTVGWSPEHQGCELRAETAGHVGGPAIRCELRHPVERAAVDQRDVDAVARMRRNLKAQAMVVVRMVEQGSGDRRSTKLPGDPVTKCGLLFGRQHGDAPIGEPEAVWLERDPAPGA